MKKFGRINLICKNTNINENNKEQADLLSSLLGNLTQNNNTQEPSTQNTETKNTTPAQNNDAEKDVNKDSTPAPKNKNNPTEPQQGYTPQKICVNPQKEWDYTTKSYMNLYPHPKVEQTHIETQTVKTQTVNTQATDNPTTKQ